MSVKPKKKIKDPAEAGPSQDDSKTLLPGGGLTRIRSGSLERLPSLRPKRDLTLGGVPKKTFAPTIPTSRRIKKEPGCAPSSSYDKVSDSRKHVEESPKNRRRSSLDKKGAKEQRKKGKKDVVTSASVFSMGPADRPMDGRTGVVPGTFGAELAKRPNVSSSSSSKDGAGSSGRNSHHHANNVVMAEEEMEEEDEDGACAMSGTVEELFSGSLIPPVQLPLDYSTHVKQRTLAPAKLVKQVKQESKDDVERMDTTESSSLMLKPAKLAKPVKAPPLSESKSHQVTAAELFTPNETTKGKFLFIQLPDCLPISMATGKETHQPMEIDKSSRASSTNTAVSNHSATTSEGESEQRHCSLVDVPEGLIGQLRVHKSGKVKLTLGDVTLDVAMGTSCGFLQQLVSVRHGSPRPRMTVLGQLSHRIVCSPDFNTMLQEASREHHL